MELLGGEYRVFTDERQFIVQRKKIVQATRMTKPENVGTEKWGDEKYFSTLKYALKYVGTDVVIQNDDLVNIKNKLDELQADINNFTGLLEIGGVKEDEED